MSRPIYWSFKKSQTWSLSHHPFQPSLTYEPTISRLPVARLSTDHRTFGFRTQRLRRALVRNTSPNLINKEPSTGTNHELWPEGTFTRPRSDRRGTQWDEYESQAGSKWWNRKKIYSEQNIGSCRTCSFFLNYDGKEVVFISLESFEGSEYKYRKKGVLALSGDINHSPLLNRETSE